MKARLTFAPLTSFTALLFALLFSIAQLYATGTDTWTGLGGDANWGTAANWTGSNTPPVLGIGVGDNIQFDGSLQTTNNNNLAINAGMASLTFNSGAAAFTLQGNGILFDFTQPGASNTIQNNSANLQTLSFTNNGGFSFNAGIALDSVNAVVNAAAGDIHITSNIELALGGSAGAQLTFDGSHDTTVNGQIFEQLGTGSLVKNGTGAVTLTNNTNSYSGGTTLNAGTLFADANNALGTGTLTITGGTLGTHNSGTTLPNNIVVNGDFSIARTGFFTLNGNVDLGGATRTITDTGTGPSLEFGGVISNGGVTFDGTAPFSLMRYSGASANTYTGLTTINSNVGLTLTKTVLNGAIQGDVVINGNGVLALSSAHPDQIADTSTVTVNSSGNTFGMTQFAGFELHNNTETIATLLGTGTVGLGSGTLTVGSGDFSGVILDGTFGAGGKLVKTDVGTLTLSGTNTYSGGTTINGGVLEISDDTNLGAPAGVVTMDNNAVLRTLASITFNASRNFTINAGGGTIDLNTFDSELRGMISGAGVFTVTDAPGFGTLTLTGDNSGLTGGLAVTNFATVSVSADNNLGAAAALLTLDDGIVETTASFSSSRQVHLDPANFGGSGTFNVDSGITTTLTGLIFGNGQLIKQGPGDLVLTSNNTYSDGTELDSGGLFSDVSPAAANNQAFGTGPIDIFGGTLGTHVDGEIVPNSLTVHGDFSTAPPTNGDLFLNGDVTLTGTFTITSQNDGSGTHFGGAIGDSGSNFGLNLADAVDGATGFNRFFFEGTTPNTYTGLTEIMDNADLHLAKSDGVTAIAGDVQVDANGTLVSDANEQIADTSTVTINSVGLVTAINPTGWLLAGHTETIGSLFGTGNISLDDQLGGSAGTLIVGAGDFSGVIDDSGMGNGELRKVGPGTLILSGNNTYTSPTTINGGILQVDGSIASTLTTVNSGGTLAGIGTIGGNVINSGVVSPGDSPGTLTITGNYTQNSNGTLHTEIGGLNSGVNSDLLHMNGTASLDGTLEVLRINNFSPLPGDQVTILLADGGRGGSTFATFSAIGWNGLIQPMPDYTDPLTVDIVFQLANTFLSQALTPNQESVAEDMDDVVGDPRADALIAFLGSEPMANLPHDFDLIAPEELASIYEIGFSQAVVTNMNLQHRMDDIRAGSTGFCGNGYQAHETGGYSKDSDGTVAVTTHSTPAFVPSPENRWGIFVTGNGDFVNVGDHDTNAHGYDITTGGVTAGVDYRVCDHFAIGIDGSYSSSRADLVDDGRVEVDGGKGGAYATVFGYKVLGSMIHLDGAVSGGWNSYDTNRTGLQDLPVRGSTNGSELNAMLAYGGDWHFGCLLVGTWSSLQYTNVNLDGFTETGSLAPLHIEDQDEDSLRSTTGLRVAYDFKAGGAIIRPEVRAGWQHEYGDRSYPIDARLASGAGDIFTVWGPHIGRDSAVVDAGLAVQWSARFSTYVYYDGVLGRSNYDSHAVSGGLRISF